MKRFVISSFASAVMATALVAAQASTPPPTSPAVEATVTTSGGQATASVAVKDANKDTSSLTGCLVQGSGPSVFLLENARMASQASSEAGKTYIVSKAAAADVDFMKNLNHKVTISGAAEEVKVIAMPSTVTVQTSKEEGKASVGVSAQSGVNKTDEKVMPKLSAKSIVSIGDTCTAPAN
ncbi:MAG: hypothetical protein ABI051_06070 [Vicinamibacterales bacterium]